MLKSRKCLCNVLLWPLLLATLHAKSVCASQRSHACSVHELSLHHCAEDGSTPLPVHVVIGNAGAELCWNVAPKTPNHFEVQSGPTLHSVVFKLLPLACMRPMLTIGLCVD